MQETFFPHYIKIVRKINLQKESETIASARAVWYNGDMAEKFYGRKITDLVAVQKIVTLHYQQLRAGYRSEVESHDFWELIYADRHGVIADMGGTEAAVAQGEAAFIQPNLPHFVICPEDSNIFIVSFACKSRAMEHFRGVVPVPPSRRALLQAIMTEAYGTFDIPDFDPALRRLELLPEPSLGGEQAIKNMLELFLIYMLRKETAHTERYFVSEFESSDDLEEAIVRYLSEHLYEPFSLGGLCGELHYGKTRLCTFFKERTGQTIYQTYLAMKTDEAKVLVRRGLSPSEVSEKLGYSSLSHFVSTFKKSVGCTPRAYALGMQK